MSGPLRLRRTPRTYQVDSCEPLERNRNPHQASRGAINCRRNRVSSRNGPRPNLTPQASSRVGKVAPDVERAAQGGRVKLICSLPTSTTQPSLLSVALREEASYEAPQHYGGSCVRVNSRKDNPFPRGNHKKRERKRGTDPFGRRGGSDCPGWTTRFLRKLPADGLNLAPAGGAGYTRNHIRPNFPQKNWRTLSEIIYRRRSSP